MKNWILSISPLFIFILLFVASMILDYFQQRELVRRRCTPEDFEKDPFD